MADFERLLPPSAAATQLLQEGSTEAGPVAALLKYSKCSPAVREEVLSKGGGLLTLSAFCEVTRFPLTLYLVRLTAQQRACLDSTLARTPTMSPLYTAWLDLPQHKSCGLVTAFMGSGRQYWIFHSLQVGYGTIGRYFTIKKRLFFFEPIESVCARLGAPEDW
jgi:hypothetical protein